MIGRESQYMYKGEYGYSFGYGITYPREIEMFDTKEEAQKIISEISDGMSMFEIVEVYI